jgi:uncharacterized membrane protein YgcG
VLFRSEVSSLVVNLAHNNGLSHQFNMAAQPTFNGDKTANAIRQQENLDFLEFQYLPQCAINFGDYRWAMTHYYPGTRTSFCERFVQVWSNGTDDDKKTFDDALKTANKKVDDFFNENDQMQRIILATVSKWFVLTFHNFFKIITKLSIFVCGMLLLAEVFTAAVWLLNSMLGTDAARQSTERRIITMLHYLKVPLVMSSIGVIEQAAVSRIISAEFDNGFLAISAILVLVESVAVFLAFKFLLKMRHDHKRALEARDHYRMQTAGIASRGVQAGLAMFGGAAGATAYSAYRERQQSEDEAEQAPEESTSSSASSGHTGFYQRPRPQMQNGTNDGQDYRPYDADATAEEMDQPVVLLERSTGRRSDNGDSNGSGGSSGNGGPSGGNGGPDSASQHNVNVDDVVDAEVVDDGLSGDVNPDADAEDPPPGSGHSSFRSPGDSRF